MKTYYSYCRKDSGFWEKQNYFHLSDDEVSQSLINCVIDAYSNKLKAYKEVDIIELIVEDNLKIIFTKKVDDNIVKKILMLL